MAAPQGELTEDNMSNCFGQIKAQNDSVKKAGFKSTLFGGKMSEGPVTHRGEIGQLGGDCRRCGRVLVIIYDDTVAGQVGVVVLGGVTVVGWRKHHGGFVCFRVLVVEVDHTSAAIRGSGHAAETKRTLNRYLMRIKDTNEVKTVNEGI